MTWGHNELANDLACHLTSPERMTWQNMQLGSSGSARPDVYALFKSYAHPNPTVYECKISKSDFRADVTSGKWRSYLNFSWSVVFAVPAGLITKEEVPEMCGLIVRHETSWRYAKKATVCPRSIDQDALLKLLIDGVYREGPTQRRKRWDDDSGIRKFEAKFGAVAARYVSDAASIERELEQAQDNRERIVKRAHEEADQIKKEQEENGDKLWKELLFVLGLDEKSRKWDVQHEVNRLREAKSGSEEGRALRAVLESLKNLTSRFDHVVAKAEEAA